MQARSWRLGLMTIAIAALSYWAFRQLAPDETAATAGWPIIRNIIWKTSAP